MGPGRGLYRGSRWRGGRTRSHSWQRQNFKTAKVSEVPVFDDNVDPRYYRERVQHWLKFQALVSDSSDKKMNFGQQLYTIISNIHGSAEDRVQYFMIRIHKNMIEDEFCSVVDAVLQQVDPIETGSRYIDTVNTWKEIMNKKQFQNQTYDQFWTEFNSLCIKYAYHHGSDSQDVGVLENLEFICMINSRVPANEFGNLMDNALSMQTSLNDSRKSGFAHGSLRKTSSKSTKDNLTIVSGLPHRPTGILIEENSAGSSNLSSSEVIQAIKNQLNDDLQRNEVTNTELGEASPELQIKITAMQTSLSSAVTRLADVCKKINDDTSTSNQQLVSRKAEPKNPNISMESVRLAFKRLDKIKQALVTKGNQEVSPGIETILTGNSSNGNNRTRIKDCYICHGDHFARDRPECLKKLKARKEDRNKKQESKKDDPQDEDKKGDSFTGISTVQRSDTDAQDAEVPWAQYEFMSSLKTFTQTTIDISTLEDTKNCEIVVDGGATNTVAGPPV